MIWFEIFSFLFDLLILNEIITGVQRGILKILGFKEPGWFAFLLTYLASVLVAISLFIGLIVGLALLLKLALDHIS